MNVETGMRGSRDWLVGAVALLAVAACATSVTPAVPWRIVPDATITSVDGRTVRVELRQPAEPPRDVSLAERIAAAIARVAYLSPNGQVTINGIAARVARVAGPTADLVLSADPVGIVPGVTAQIVTDPRAIAIRSMVPANRNHGATRGTLWIDEVSFY